MKRISAILGAGFGDEGKGRSVSYLCSKNHFESKIVVRFNGGHQAGHTVVHDGKRHIFSSFGSGTLQRVSTYWSKYCTVHPNAFLNELTALNKLGIEPKIFIDALSPITTPWDVISNLNDEKYLKDGTCGVGFGKTIERHNRLKLYFSDLYKTNILNAKVDSIIDYYANDIEKVKDVIDNKKIKQKFMNDCNDLIAFTGKEHFYNVDVLDNYKHIIFEGAQGILLDQDFGFYPNVTWSNTTIKNALEIINEINEDKDNVLQIYYVTRPYQTRHGSGFMSDERELNLINDHNETNIVNQYQKKFRKGLFDYDLFNYAINCNSLILNNTNKFYESNLIITCADQMPEFPVIDIIKDKKVQKFDMFCMSSIPFEKFIVFNGSEIYHPKLAMAE